MFPINSESYQRSLGGGKVPLFVLVDNDGNLHHLKIKINPKSTDLIDLTMGVRIPKESLGEHEFSKLVQYYNNKGVEIYVNSDSKIKIFIDESLTLQTNYDRAIKNELHGKSHNGEIIFSNDRATVVHLGRDLYIINSEDGIHGIRVELAKIENFGLKFPSRVIFPMTDQSLHLIISEGPEKKISYDEFYYKVETGEIKSYIIREGLRSIEDVWWVNILGLSSQGEYWVTDAVDYIVSENMFRKYNMND